MHRISIAASVLLGLVVLAAPDLAEAHSKEALWDLATLLHDMAERDPQQGTLRTASQHTPIPRASKHEAAYVVEQLVGGSDWNQLGTREQLQLSWALREMKAHIEQHALSHFTPIEQGMAEGAIGIQMELPGFGSSKTPPIFSIVRKVGGDRAGAVEINVPTSDGRYLTHIVNGPKKLKNPYFKNGVRVSYKTSSK
jgi:hypothetical protein